MTQTLAKVREHLRGHFAEAGIDTEPDVASVTFLGAEPIEVLRFHPGADGVVHYLPVEGVVLTPDALTDLGLPLWARP